MNKRRLAKLDRSNYTGNIAIGVDGSKRAERACHDGLASGAQVDALHRISFNIE